MRTRRFVIGSAATSVVLAVTALGGIADAASGNGVASKSAKSIVTTGISTTAHASSFTVDGTVRQGSQSYGFKKLSVSKVGNAKGSIVVNGQELKVLEVDNVVYISADKAFWSKQVNASAGQLLGGKWVYGGKSNQGLGSIKSLLAPKTLTQGFFPAPTGTYHKGRTSTIKGQRVIAVTRTKGSSHGTLYVATTGKPYMVRVAAYQTNSARGILTFTGYNRPVKTTAPQNAINLSQLQQGTTPGT